MNIENLKKILISDFLNREGFSPVRRSGGQQAFRAPYRADNDPSLIVNDRKGVWYDHGEGQGGNIIDLALRLYNTTDVQFAVQRINKLYGNVPVEKIEHERSLVQNSPISPHQIVRVTPLGSNLAITSYLQSRGVFEAASQSKRVVEVYYDYIDDTGGRKRYFGAGWKNNSGGYDVRSKYGKICINHKDMLTIAGDTGRTNVFEGMMNFLSALKENSVSMTDTNIVLNSLSLSKKAIARIDADRPTEINVYLDNGAGGNKFTKIFAAHFPFLHDRRYLYKGFSDYNEKLMNDMQDNLRYRR